MVNSIILNAVPLCTPTKFLSRIHADYDDTIGFGIDLSRQCITCAGKVCTPCTFFSYLPSPSCELSAISCPFARNELQVFHDNRFLFSYQTNRVTTTFFTSRSNRLCILGPVTIHTRYHGVICITASNGAKPIVTHHVHIAHPAVPSCQRVGRSSGGTTIPSITYCTSTRTGERKEYGTRSFQLIPLL